MKGNRANKANEVNFMLYYMRRSVIVLDMEREMMG